MRCADWIIHRLSQYGCREIFGVTGGAVVHLFDAAEKHSFLSVSYFNHEQSAAFAAEAYAKYTSELSVCLVTTGPGATNALTGLSAAWLDSVPMVFISGQTRSNNTIAGRNLRQVGTQEVDIISMVQSSTKRCIQIKSPQELLDVFDSVVQSAFNGRPGPVWLDICVDVLWSQCPQTHHSSIPSIATSAFPEAKEFYNSTLTSLVAFSQRPMLLLGGGCRTPVINDLEYLLNSIGIPFATTWLGYDLVSTSSPLHVGNIGMSGQRGANLLAANADLLICIGSSVSTSVTSTITKNFAPSAIRVNVNIDVDDFSHTKEIFHYNINDTVYSLITFLRSACDGHLNINPMWIEFYELAKKLSFSEQPKESSYVHPFSVLRRFNSIGPDDLCFVIDGGGTTVYSSFQALMPINKRRIILSCGLCSMGSGLPEALGISRSGTPIVLFCGDGSFPFNVQELQKVRDQNLPILYIVFSNNAYLSIRTTQSQFLENRHFGSVPPQVHLLNIKLIAKAFEIPYLSAKSLMDLDDFLESYSYDSPFIIEVATDPDQEIQPRQSFSEFNGRFFPNPLSRMDPPLSDSLQHVIDRLQINSAYLPENEINLLKSYPNSTKTRSMRIAAMRPSSLDSVSDVVIKDKLIREARQYGREYFDGNRLYGYGGYTYDPRYWSGVAKDIVSHFSIPANSSILDIGCAKGFLLYELQQILIDPKLFGLDISKYALKCAHPNLKAELLNSPVDLIFESHRSYDYIFAINLLSELPYSLLVPALRAIGRLSLRSSYVNLLTWNSETEREMIDAWNITSQSILTRQEWIHVLKEASYNGCYSFTSLSF